MIAFPVCFPALHKGFLYIRLGRSDTSFSDYLAVHTIFPKERLSDKLAPNLKMDGDKEVEPCSLPQRTVARSSHCLQLLVMSDWSSFVVFQRSLKLSLLTLVLPVSLSTKEADWLRLIIKHWMSEISKLKSGRSRCRERLD